MAEEDPTVAYEEPGDHDVTPVEVQDRCHRPLLAGAYVDGSALLSGPPPRPGPVALTPVGRRGRR